MSPRGNSLATLVKALSDFFRSSRDGSHGSTLLGKVVAVAFLIIILSNGGRPVLNVLERQLCSITLSCRQMAALPQTPQVDELVDPEEGKE